MIQSLLSCTVVPTACGKTPVELTLRRKTLELAASCKSDSNHISISGIAPRRDKLNFKAAQVNSFLKNECG